MQIALREKASEYRVVTNIEQEQNLVKAWKVLPNQLQQERVLTMLEAFSFSV